ncbi:MAG: cobyric acid synthase CobQ, partial [Planctomycetia bacterium]|nr:cobyric acid synthase CobQ [Planctomycetia bacterium]
HAKSLDETALNITVIHLPHIANFDDFDPLSNEPSVRLRYARSIEQLGTPDAIVLPGTKNTLGDLNWLRTTGLADRIVSLAGQGAAVVGICGGYQMLGRQLLNPDRLESDWHSADGLRLLDVETTFLVEKQTYQVQAEVIDDTIAPGTLRQRLSGYEIHMGETISDSAWLKRVRMGSNANNIAFDGARSEDGRVWGCYLHGLFHNDQFRCAWLSSLGVKTRVVDAANANDAIQLSLNRLADALESHMDMNRLEQIIWHKEHLKSHV